jgi:hypothetical protein
MNRLKWLLVAVLLLAFSWTYPAHASNVYFEFYTFGFGNDSIDGNTYHLFAQDGGLHGYGLNYTPITPGFFSQHGSFQYSFSVDFIYYNEGSGFFTYHPPVIGLYAWIDLDQSEPLPFTDLNWEVRMLKDSTETTIFSLSADADFITNGGIAADSIAFDFGTLLIPIGHSEHEYIFNMYQTGHVVPVPATLLLFGSGLLGLAGWRRFRKG